MTTTVARPIPRRRLRTWGVLTLLGTSAIIVGFLVTGEQLNSAVATVNSLHATADTLLRQTDSLKKETAGLREALTAARAAINAFHAGDYLGAVSLYDKVLRDDSSNAYLLNLRAYALFKAGRIDDAIRSQQLSLRADSTYAWGYFDLARFECARGRWDAAKAALDRLLRMAPEMRSTVDRDGEFRRLCRRILRANPLGVVEGRLLPIRRFSTRVNRGSTHPQLRVPHKSTVV